MLLNDADAIYLGTSEADRVYLGSTQVWPHVASYGPEESLYPVSVTVAEPYDGSGYTLASRFSVSADGQITAFRLYSFAHTSSRYVALWKDDGTLLATGTTTAETLGWNLAPITPVPVLAGQTYRVGYFKPPGDSFPYNVSPPSGSAHMTWLNGAYAVGGAPAFPTNLVSPNNYFADVIYEPVT